MKMILNSVLLLNASYEPLLIIGGQRAMTMLVKQKAIVEVESGHKVHGYDFPSVLRLQDYRRIPQRRMHNLKRKDILLRDGNTCQYCGKEFDAKVLTLDHVIPASRGGPYRWENLVACCAGCNQRKDNRTPAEAEMPLRRPVPPMTIHTAKHLLRQRGLATPAWSQYLYNDSNGVSELVRRA